MYPRLDRSVSATELQKNIDFVIEEFINILKRAEGVDDIEKIDMSQPIRREDLLDAVDFGF